MKLVQQHVIDMPYVRIPLEVIAALVKLDTMVKMAETVFQRVSAQPNKFYAKCVYMI